MLSDKLIIDKMGEMCYYITSYELNIKTVMESAFE